MTYGVRWLPSAEADLTRVASIDAAAASEVLDRIDELAADPVGLSRRAGFPHPPFQKFQFWTGDLFVTVLFQYAQDESSIEIVAIGFVRRR